MLRILLVLFLSWLQALGSYITNFIGMISQPQNGYGEKGSGSWEAVRLEGDETGFAVEQIGDSTDPVLTFIGLCHMCDASGRAKGIGRYVGTASVLKHVTVERKRGRKRLRASSTDSDRTV